MADILDSLYGGSSQGSASPAPAPINAPSSGVGILDTLYTGVHDSNAPQPQTPTISQTPLVPQKIAQPNTTSLFQKTKGVLSSVGNYANDLVDRGLSKVNQIETPPTQDELNAMPKDSSDFDYFMKFLPSELARGNALTGPLVTEAQDNPESVPYMNPMDAVKAIPGAAADQIKSILNTPVRIGLSAYDGITGKNTTLNIPLLGESTGYASQLIKRIDNGENPWIAGISTGSGAILDTIFLAGAIHGTFAPREVITAENTVPASGILKESTIAREKPTSFRLYQNKVSNTPLSPQAIAKMRQQGVLFGDNFDPARPTYFKVEYEPKTETFKGSVVQLKPSIASTFASKFKSKVTNVPDSEVLKLTAPKTITVDQTKQLVATAAKNHEIAGAMAGDVNAAIATHGEAITHQALQDHFGVTPDTAQNIITRSKPPVMLPAPVVEPPTQNGIVDSLYNDTPETSPTTIQGLNPKQPTKLSVEEAAPYAEIAATKHWDNVIAPEVKKGGAVVIGADDLKDHFGGDYNDNNYPVYSRAAFLQYERALKEDKDGTVVLTGGGPASGKSELVVKSLKRQGFKGVIYDSNLSNYEGAVKQIEAARAAGKHVEINGVLPNIDKARSFSVIREHEIGRGISDTTFARGHSGFPAVVRKLLENGIMKPEDVHILDTRTHTTKEHTDEMGKNGGYVKDPFAILRGIDYNEDTLKKQYAKENYNKVTGEREDGRGVQERSKQPSDENRTDKELTEKEIPVRGSSSLRKKPSMFEMPTPQNSFGGFVNAGEVIDQMNAKVKNFVEKTLKPVKLGEDLSESFYKLEGEAQADLETVAKVIKEVDANGEDSREVYRYAEGSKVDLTPKQKALFKEVIDPMRKLNRELVKKIRAAGAPLSEDDTNTYMPRQVVDKSSTMQKIFKPTKGKNPTASQGGVLSKSTGSLKHRVYRSLTDEEGNKTVVAIKNGEVTAFHDKEPEHLGHIKANITPVIKEFYDTKVTPVLEQLAKDLGIKHVRSTGKEKGLGPKQAGVSYNGANLIKTRAGAPERVLLHEIGHQLDYRYDLKKLFSDKTLPRKYMPVPDSLLSDVPSETSNSPVEDRYYKAQQSLDYYNSRYESGIESYRNLQKYTVKGKKHENFGQLPEITGKNKKGLGKNGKPNLFARQGYSFIDELGFGKNGDDPRDEANDFIEFFKDVIEQRKIWTKEFREAKKEKRTEDSLNKFLERGASKTDKSIKPSKNPTTYNAAKELRAVADLRLGDTYTPSFKAYVRNSDEKMAALFEAYLHVPDKFQEVAPNTFAKFEEFLQDHPELHPILNLNPSLNLGSRKVGGEHKAGLNGDIFIDKSGKKYTIGDATTDEITKETGQEYFQDAVSTIMLQHVKLAQIARAIDFTEQWKASPEFAEISVPSDEIAPQGWKQTTNQSFRNYWFEPHVAEILDDMQTKISTGQYNDAFTGINRALSDAIFFNGLAHPINVLVTWAYNRGVSGLLPTTYGPAVRAGARALKAMQTKNQDYMDLLRNGAHLMSSDVSAKTLGEQLMNKFNQDIGKDPTMDEKMLNAFGKVGGQFSFKKNVIYKLSHDMAWLSNDFLTMQSIFEQMEREGVSMEEAIKEASRFIPDYRRDSRLLDKPLSAAFGEGIGGANSRKLAEIMYNPKISMFGSYHVGLFKSLKNAMADTIGAGEGFSKEDNIRRLKGIDKLAMLAVLMLVVYPWLDRMMKELSGSPDTYVTRSGITKYPYLAYRALTGEADASQVASGIITPAVGTQLVLEEFFNKDFFTGEKIHGPGSEGNAGHILSKIAPVAEVQRMAKGNATVEEFGGSMLGVRTPKNTPEAITLNQLIYDEKGVVSKKVKATVAGGDTEGALQMIKDYNRKLIDAIKAADIKNGNSGSDARVDFFLNKYGMRMPSEKTMETYNENQGKAVVDKVLPSGKPVIKKETELPSTGIIGAVTTYAKAIAVDPVTAFKDIFTGQSIREVRNGTVIVNRMSLQDSTAVKKSQGGNNPQMKLDHTLPLQLGGDNSEENLKLVPTDVWASYTSVENYLGRALKNETVDKKTAQKLIVDFKNGKITFDEIKSQVDK